MFGKVRPRAVIGDDFAAGVGLHLRLPILLRLFEAFFKGSVSLSEIGGIIRAHFAELGLDAFGNAQTIFRIEPVMRIPKRMDVAFSASDLARGYFEDFGKTRGVKISGCGNLNLGIAGLGDERRKPADLQFEADDDEEIGLAKFEQKLGLASTK